LIVRGCGGRAKGRSGGRGECAKGGEWAKCWPSRQSASKAALSLPLEVCYREWAKGPTDYLPWASRRPRPGCSWRAAMSGRAAKVQPKLAALLRELSWSHNLAIMTRSKRDEEREFYLRMATRERWSFRELQRQLNGALFERTVLAPLKLSTPLA